MKHVKTKASTQISHVQDISHGRGYGWDIKREHLSHQVSYAAMIAQCHGLSNTTVMH